MVMPRAFSSARRSVSTPVRARTSAVLPWSICPAVPTIIARAAPPSIAGQEGVEAAPLPFGVPHHQVEAQAGDVVGDGFQRGIAILIQDLDPAAAFAADLGLDRGLAGLDRAIGDALGRAAAEAFHPHLVPQRLTGGA